MRVAVLLCRWYWLGLTHLCLARGWRCSCHSQWRWCHESPSSASLRSEFAPRPSTGSDSVGSGSTGWSICSWSCGPILYSSWTRGLREVMVIREQLDSTKTVYPCIDFQEGQTLSHHLHDWSGHKWNCNSIRDQNVLHLLGKKNKLTRAWADVWHVNQRPWILDKGLVVEGHACAEVLRIHWLAELSVCHWHRRLVLPCCRREMRKYKTNSSLSNISYWKMTLISNLFAQIVLLSSATTCLSVWCLPCPQWAAEHVGCRCGALVLEEDP